MELRGRKERNIWCVFCFFSLIKLCYFVSCFDLDQTALFDLRFDKQWAWNGAEWRETAFSMHTLIRMMIFLQPHATTIKRIWPYGPSSEHYACQSEGNGLPRRKWMFITVNRGTNGLTRRNNAYAEKSPRYITVVGVKICLTSWPPRSVTPRSRIQWLSSRPRRMFSASLSLSEYVAMYVASVCKFWKFFSSFLSFLP